MQIHVYEIASPHRRVQAELYTALELIRVADQKARLAIDADVDAFRLPQWAQEVREEWDRDTSLCNADMLESQAVCRVFGAILQEICTGVPVLPDRVFRDLLAFENSLDLNPPHVEGLGYCLLLASAHLSNALDLSAKLDGDDIDDSYRVMQAAYRAIHSQAVFIDCNIRGGVPDEVLEAIVAGTYVRELATA